MSLLLLLRPAGLSVPQDIFPDPVIISVEFPAVTVTADAGILASVVTIAVVLPAVTITGADVPVSPCTTPCIRLASFSRVRVIRGPHR